LAEELRKWIPSALQFAKPYFTPSDIEKGAKWSTEISQQLSETHVGIICLTRENYQKPWILFEAGALSKDLDNSRICSVLFGMDNSDLDGPLTTFQTTMFDKPDFKKLMQSINEAGGDQKLDRDTFEDVFEMWWPRLEAKIKGIMGSQGKEDHSELRNDRALLEEILSLSRLSTQRNKSQSVGFSPAALNDIIKSATNLLDEALTYKDKDILNSVSDIHGASKHIARKSGLEDDVSSATEILEDRLSGVRAILENTREIPDEVPF
jgi:hypothetical protein